MKKVIKFLLIGALILIVADSLLRYFQMISFNDFGNNADFDLARIFFLFTLFLFQWVFILALIIYHLIRKRINTDNKLVGIGLGFIICFAFYSFYWLGADEGDLKTLRLALINCVVFSFIIEKLYRKIVLN